MLIWKSIKNSKELTVQIVQQGHKLGYSKNYNRSEAVARHFAEIIGLPVQEYCIGIVNKECKLVFIQYSNECCDLADAKKQGLPMKAALEEACEAFPFVSWLACGDHEKEENWIRDIINDRITIMPIDFECALTSDNDIISTILPNFLTKNKFFISKGVDSLKKITDEHITETMNNFGFTDEQIASAISRREKLEGEFRKADLI